MKNLTKKEKQKIWDEAFDGGNPPDWMVDGFIANVRCADKDFNVLHDLPGDWTIDYLRSIIKRNRKLGENPEWRDASIGKRIKMYLDSE